LRRTIRGSVSKKAIAVLPQQIFGSCNVLPIAVFDDVVGIAVFFTVNAIVARQVSGVFLVFTGIACQTLSARPELASIVQGTIAAAAVINEIIAVIVAKRGFALAGEITADPSSSGQKKRKPGREKTRKRENRETKNI
jgi:hypothetical protein